jgi:hypothetical protein
MRGRKHDAHLDGGIDRDRFDLADVDLAVGDALADREVVIPPR